MNTDQTHATPPDGRSVEELIRDSDILARDMLFDHDIDPEARLRTFGEVVESALDLWETIPSRLRDDRLDSLHGSMKALHRSIATDPTWPGIGAPDPTMEQITSNLTRAAELIATRRLRGFDLSPPGQRAAEGIRVRVLHTLFISAHATLVAAQGHLCQIDTRQQRSNAAQARVHQGASHVRDRVASIEHDLSLLIDMHWPLVLTRQDPPEPPSPSRLDAAIAHWDAHAHRTLTTSPSLPNLICVTAVQRNLTFLTALVTTAAAEAGGLDPTELHSRLLPALDNLQNAWGKLYADLARLLGGDRLISTELRAAENELTAAAREISHDRTHLASPALIAERVDLPTTINSLQRGLAVGVNLGYTIQDALENRLPRVAARPALDLAMATAAPVPEQGWVGARSVHHNHDVTMPVPVRDHLLHTASTVIRASIDADSSSAILSRSARSSRPIPDGSIPRSEPPNASPPPTAAPRAPRPARGR